MVKFHRKDDDCELKDNTFSLDTIDQNYSLMTLKIWRNTSREKEKALSFCLLHLFW